MNFDLGAFVLNPFVLLFTTAFLGIALGKIKIRKFSLGLPGALFSGLFLSWASITFATSVPKDSVLYTVAHKVITDGVISKNFFDLFLCLFIASIGLLTGKDIARVLKKYGVKFLILGFAITFTGIVATYGYLVANKQLSSYQISGIYAGALTSSPGLAASLDTVKNKADIVAQKYPSLSVKDKDKVLNKIDTSGKLTPVNTPKLSNQQVQTFITAAQGDVSTGFTLAFPFGLLTIILSMMLIPKIFRIDVEKEKEIYEEEIHAKEIQENDIRGKGMNEIAATKGKTVKLKEVDFSLISFVFVCLFGYFIGTFEFNIGIGTISLGSTGGILVSSLACSYIGKIGPLNFRMDTKILGVIRQLGIGLFLSTVGLMYGNSIVSAFKGSGVVIAMMGLSVVILAVLVGFLVGRYILKLNWMILSGAICGGMTSTPGLGAAVDAVGNDYPAIGYGAVYPFALIYKVLFIMILHKLFII